MVAIARVVRSSDWALSVPLYSALLLGCSGDVSVASGGGGSDPVPSGSGSAGRSDAATIPARRTTTNTNGERSQGSTTGASASTTNDRTSTTVAIDSGLGSGADSLGSSVGDILRNALDGGLRTGLQPNTVQDGSLVNKTDASATPTLDGVTQGAGALPSCPNCRRIFDGMTLNGWIASAAKGWDIKDNAIHGTGTAGRGYIYTKDDYGDFRLIFSVRHITGGHAPCILIFSTHPPPALDALGAIQFQPPNGGTWDYRPGKNNNGGNLFMKLPHPNFDSAQWNQCEVLAHVATGEFRAACCQLMGNTPCKGTELLRFKDPTAGKKGPIGLQVHNGGLQDEYKDIYIEMNPTVDDLVTTH